jgi:DNA-binding CsgD family transcriptional regulator
VGGVATRAASRAWPFTGRHLIVESALDALSEDAAALFLFGEPGVGKTRLAHELVHRLDAQGRPTARIIATIADRGSPLAALAHLLPPMEGRDAGAVFHSAREAFAADTDRLVLHVDDAHVLDPSSASLLGSLADAGVVQLVVTARTGDPLPDAFAALRSSDAAVTITVDTLDAISVDSLLHRALGAPLDGAAEAQLLEVSGGNPFFLRELVLGAIEDGVLREVAGVWRLDGTIPANAALIERVLDRVRHLPDTARDALDVIAVAEPLGLDDLEATFPTEVLEELERRALIRVDAEERRSSVRLAHPIYAEAVRSMLGRIRFRRLARDQVERVLAHGGRRRDDGLRMARWQMEAGLSPDPEQALAAARVARHALDFESTVELARAALAAGEVRAAPVLGTALYELGDFAGVEEVVVEALAAEPLEPDFVQLIRTRAMGLLWGSGDHQLAISTLTAAEAAVVEPRHGELLRCARALDIAWSGDPAGALELAEPLLRSDHPTTAAQAALTVELVAATAGPTTQAITVADRWFAVHLDLADKEEASNPGNHLITKALALANAGRLTEAEELAALGYRASVASRRGIGQMWFALLLARLALARGDAAAADRLLREQIALCQAIGHRRPMLIGLSQHAIALTFLGQVDAARQALATIDADPVVVLPLFAVERARAEGWVLAAEGHVAAARQVVVDGATTAERAGITLLAALARVDALRLGDQDQAGPLRAAAALVESPIVDTAAAWAEAGADGPALEAVAGSLADMGFAMHAAEAWSQAAAAWRDAGDRRRATAAERTADELARACTGSSTPTLARVDSVVPLTAREREVALLTARGLTAKEVGERLVVSSRTVSNHLQNVYTKLGISSRAELADAIGQLGEDPSAELEPTDGSGR